MASSKPHREFSQHLYGQIEEARGAESLLPESDPVRNRWIRQAVAGERPAEWVEEDEEPYRPAGHDELNAAIRAGAGRPAEDDEGRGE
jgi:hypothetical protein